MRKFVWLVRNTPGLRYLARTLLRTRIAIVESLIPHATDTLRWLFGSLETANLTYNLETPNQQFLAANVAFLTGRSRNEIIGLFKEASDDPEVRATYSATRAASPQGFICDPDIRLARRKVWYALARLLRPRVIVETGVDKGLGSLILCAALRRNTAEGYPGRYYGTDIKPGAGWLLADSYRDFGEILIGDSIESLQSLDGPIDMLIADSCHDPQYEAREYAVAKSKLASSFLVISDQGTTTLMEAADTYGWRFFSLRERATRTILEGTDFGLAFTADLTAKISERREGPMHNAAS
jgi:predicted O-methyltransferase YrrM